MELEVDADSVNVNSESRLRTWTRNAIVLVIVSIFSGTGGFFAGAMVLAQVLLSDGPAVGVRLMDLGVRLQAFDPASDVFEWRIDGQGAFAGSWEEIQKKFEASSVESEEGK